MPGSGNVDSITDAEPGGIHQVSSFLSCVPRALFAVLLPSLTLIIPLIMWNDTPSFGPALTTYQRVNSPGFTLNNSASLLSSSLFTWPTAGTYLWAIPFVSTRSGLFDNSLPTSNDPVPFVPTNTPLSALLYNSPNTK